MAAEARRRRSKQQSVPIIHFYEQFIKSTSARSDAKANSSVDTTSPTVQLSVDSMRYHRQRSMSSDTTVKIGMYSSPDTVTNRRTIAAVRGETTRITSSPLSPLTPPAEEPSTRHRGKKSTKYTTARSRKNNGLGKDHTTRETQVEKQQKNPSKRLTMYERSQMLLKEREKKIQRLRNEMMQECTFRPNTAPIKVDKTKGQGHKRGSTADVRTMSLLGKSPPSIISSTLSSTAATTPTTTSTTRQYWQDLQHKQQQQQQQQQQRQHSFEGSATVSKDGSLPSRISSTTKSVRFEELYKDGLRKARQRPATEKAEEALRNQRLEDEQLRECTFKPKLYWGGKVATNRRKPLISGTQASTTSSRIQSSRGGHRSLSPRRKIPVRTAEGLKPKPWNSKAFLKEDPIVNIDLSLIENSDECQDESCGSLSLLRRHHNIMRGRSRRADSPVPPPLPLEIFTNGIVAASPVRTNWKTALYTRDEGISPLRGPMPGNEIDLEGEQSPMAPRIIFCGTTVGGESIAAQTSRTEYGSI